MSLCHVVSMSHVFVYASKLNMHGYEYADAHITQHSAPTEQILKWQRKQQCPSNNMDLSLASGKMTPSVKNEQGNHCITELIINNIKL